MKIVNEKMEGDKRLVTVELDKDEELMAFRDDAFYRLGQPLDDVVLGHIITDAAPVAWCSISQKWEA